jgi:hypothetical protein
LDIHTSSTIEPAPSPKKKKKKSKKIEERWEMEGRGEDRKWYP